MVSPIHRHVRDLSDHLLCPFYGRLDKSVIRSRCRFDFYIRDQIEGPPHHRLSREIDTISLDLLHPFSAKGRIWIMDRL